MKTYGKRLPVLFTALGVVLLLFGCKAPAPKGPELSGKGVMHELEFGGVYVDSSIDDFNALGFEYGDSVDVKFSSGYTMEGLPYYSGYYTLTGDPLLVAYPGYPYIKVCINNGDDLWNIAGLKEGDSADISLHEKGEYLSVQEMRNIVYRDDRSEFPSDEVFANFRSVSVSKIKENVLYRSASPCDDQHKRALYADALIREAGVSYIVDLADDDEKIRQHFEDTGHATPYFESLYDSGKVYPAALTMNYGSPEFKANVAGALRSLLNEEGPYLVHCTEGKDRTGYVCILLEALCDTPYREIEEDYMITYRNYYGITKEEDPDKYEALVEYVLQPMVQVFRDDGKGFGLRAASLSAGAEKYLLDGGMSYEEISDLRERLAAR